MGLGLGLGLGVGLELGLGLGLGVGLGLAPSEGSKPCVVLGSSLPPARKPALCT